MAVINTDTIKQLVREFNEGSPYFLVDVKTSSRDNRFKVVLDGDRGADIQRCVDTARYINRWMEENDPEFIYELEVSSPGADEPIVLHRQYNKNIGRTLEIQTREGDKIRAKLKSWTEETGLVLEEQVKEKGKKSTPVERIIPLGDIQSSRAVIQFN